MRFRGRRALLNRSGIQSTAAIVAEVEDTRNWQTGRHRNGTPLHLDDETDWELVPEYTLKISDCDRAVNLVVAFDDARGRRASLEKVDTLIGALVEFRHALADEQRLYVIRRRTARLAGPPPEENKDAE